MQTKRIILSAFKIPQIVTLCIGVTFAASVDSFGAQVVERATSSAVQSRPTVRTNNSTSRLPTMQIKTAQQVSTPETPAPEPEPTPEPEPVTNDTTPTVENKSLQFDRILGDVSESSTDTAADTRADIIRTQRATLDAAAATAGATQRIEDALAGNANACDTGLRDCMKQTCGNDFSRCAGDGDTIWGNKLDTCRRNLKCSGEEFQLFAGEIKADRDHNSKMASYNEVINCGNRYNSCIIAQCGVDFAKCLGKSAGDKAINDCATIARGCQTADNGLASRATQVFGTLRTGAEEQAKRDELRLYELRDLMAAQCNRIGALFDERSLDCVFTVNFFAGDTNTLFASKKAYAGDTFDCTQNWFGVDITTYRENAYRLTREQTAASSSFMGAGVGVAAGAVASGAIDRAMDRAKANNALNAAEEYHETAYGSGANVSSEKKNTDQNNNEEKKPEDRQAQPAPTSAVDEASPAQSTSKAAPIITTTNIGQKYEALATTFKTKCISMNGRIEEKNIQSTSHPAPGKGIEYMCWFDDLTNTQEDQKKYTAAVNTNSDNRMQNSYAARLTNEKDRTLFDRCADIEKINDFYKRVEPQGGATLSDNLTKRKCVLFVPYPSYENEYEAGVTKRIQEAEEDRKKQQNKT